MPRLNLYRFGLSLLLLTLLISGGFSQQSALSRTPEAPSTARRYLQLHRAADHLKAKDYHSAAVLASQALKMLISIDDQEGILSARLILAESFAGRKQYLNAQYYLKQMLADIDRSRAMPATRKGLVYRAYGDLFKQMGQLAEAGAAYHRAIEAYGIRPGRFHNELFQLYKDWAMLHIYNGNLNVAVKHFQMALKFTRQYTPEDRETHHETIMILRNISRLLSAQQNTGELFENSLRLLAIFYEDNPSSYPDNTAVNAYLGWVYFSQHDFERSSQYYQNALQASRADSQDSLRFAAIHFNLANSLESAGDAAAAAREAARGYRLLPTAGPVAGKLLGTCQLLLAEYYQKNRQDKAALAMFRNLATAEMSKKSDLPGPAERIRLYCGLAHGHARIGAHDEALAWFSRALLLNKQTFGAQHSGVAVIYKAIGEFYAGRDDHIQALVCFQEALEANSNNFQATELNDNPTVEDALDSDLLQAVLLAKGRSQSELAARAPEFDVQKEYLMAALESFELSVELVETKRRRIRRQPSKLQLAPVSFSLYDAAIETCLALDSLTGNESYSQRAFLLAEKSKAGMLYASLLESRARQNADIPDRFLKMESGLRINLQYYREKIRQTIANPASGKLAKYQRLYQDTEQRHGELIRRIEQRHPDYYSLKQPASRPTLAQIQAAIPAEAALLEYFEGENIIAAFLLTGDRFDCYVQRKPAGFNRKVRQFYKSLREPEATTEYTASAYWLYQHLIEPLSQHLEKRRRLIIIPDGVLSYLPFEALLSESSVDLTRRSNEKPLPYLILDHEFSYHFSAALYLKNYQTSEKSTEYAFLGFAPVFADSQSAGYVASARQAAQTPVISVLQSIWQALTRDDDNFKPLLYSEVEISEILKSFKDHAQNSSGFFHRQATEANFKAYAGKFKYLHLATHSFVNPGAPGESGIAFAPSESSSHYEDGVLYASEIYNLDLKADLVVLSSCESGLGKLIRGEGMMAMTRGFLFAGASNVIVSLWKVQDKKTADLMIKFYRNYHQSGNYTGALHRAKLAMIANKSTSAPAAWSSFILIGR